MPLLQTGWINRKTTIEALCDLANGWHEMTYSYGYREQEFLDFPGDYRIRFEVKVTYRSGTLALPDFPSDAVSQGSADGCEYDLKGGKLTLHVPLGLSNGLNTSLRWFLTNNRKLAFEVYMPGFYSAAPLYFDTYALAVFWPPKGKEPRTERDWENRFFPGGLPSLGKKR